MSCFARISIVLLTLVFFATAATNTTNLFGLEKRVPFTASRLVGSPDVGCVAVDLGVDGDGGDAHFLAGTHDSDCDLAAIGDQYLGEHGRGLY